MAVRCVQDDLASKVPTTGAVEWVVIQTDLQRQAFGVDLASGAWYRVAYNKVTGWSPSGGVLSGWAIPDGVVASQGTVEKRDAMVDQLACPTVYLRRTLNDTAHSNGWTLRDAPESGWVLTVPLDRSGTGNRFAYEFVIGPDARVISKRRTDEEVAEIYRTYEESPSGFQLTLFTGAQSITNLKVSPAGKTWTAAEVARIAIENRREESIARPAKFTDPVSMLKAGEAESSPAVRVDTVAKVGPALILAGVLLVVAAGFTWWRRRS